MEVDIRSETREELNRAVENFTRLMHEAVEEENRARSTSQGKIQFDVKLIGDRPFGEIFQTAPIVQTAAAGVRDGPHFWSQQYRCQYPPEHGYSRDYVGVRGHRLAKSHAR